MKFQVLSDLHLEFFRSFDAKFNFVSSLKTDVDYVLLAGDISAGKSIVQDYNLVADILGKIVYVTGNHEYYNSSKHHIDTLLTQNVDGVFLNDQSITIGDVTIIGGTGWNSSFNERGSRGMNDFRLIEELVNDKYKSIEWSRNCHDFFNEKLLNREGKVICLTHNAPTLDHTPDIYKGDDLNAFFVNDWDDLFTYDPIYWISGHLHQSLAMTYKRTRCIENSFGYVGKGENKTFNKQLVIEV